MQALKEATDADGRRRLRSRNSRRSRRSRRLKGGGAAAAALAGSAEEQETETWTSLGLSGANELSRLPASTFSGVMLIWAFFVVCAIVRSVYDQHVEEGNLSLGSAVDNKLLSLRRSVTQAELDVNQSIERFQQAAKPGSASAGALREHETAIALAQKELEESQLALETTVKQGYAPKTVKLRSEQPDRVAQSVCLSSELEGATKQQPDR